ncbi:hypothetical protein ACWDR1_07065 [Streptosporangium sandarakinum]
MAGAARAVRLGHAGRTAGPRRSYERAAWAVRLDGGSVRLRRVGLYGWVAWAVRLKDSPGGRSAGLATRGKPLVRASVGVR